MQFSFTPAAARKVLALMAEKGEGLVLRIQIKKSITGEKWSMTFEPAKAVPLMVDGVPVVVDAGTEKLIDGMVIDWVQTPEGAGFGVYERNLRDLRVLPR
ncbi:MAG TPA: iron-sulfur cluster biosynthesis family protein [Symbiobacteriaceae bacterium]|nr:iron-sulfur cluster biosynthesis family protein [Symbiobacteriaceae bacterium]